MRLHRPLSVLAAVALPAASALLVASAAPADSAPVTASAMLAQLVVAAPVTTGYDRALFGAGWADADGDGCDTRAEVLKVESLDPVTLSFGCTVNSGRWTSPYDGVTSTSSRDVTVDTTVSRAEAWASGAGAWTADRRIAFANDLGYPGSLVTVTRSLASEKADQDVTTWLPPVPSAVCGYVVDRVAVKWRWDLTVDPDEQATLARLLGTDGCGARVVDVSKAPVPPPVEATDRLDAGNLLTSGHSLVAADGSYRATMQGDGNLVVYRTGGGAVFDTHTSGNPGARLAMTSDGRLILYSTVNRALWTDGASGTGAHLTMQTDGNLVHYVPAGALWSSRGGLITPPTPAPTGPTLAAGQVLRAGQQLANAGYRLVMQADGNLVDYTSTGRVLWQSRTSGQAGATLVMQGDGNGVLYAGGVARFDTHTSRHPGARLTLGSDGNAVIYTTSNQPLFRTGADRG